MASLYQRPGSDHWWIRYTEGGRQFRKSLKTADRSKADLELRRMELLFAQHAATGTVSKDWVKAIQEKTLQPLSIKEAFETSRKRVGGKTAATYKSRDEIFLAWLKENHPTATLTSEITRPMLTAFLEGVADRHKARTHNGYLRRLRSAFRWAVKANAALEDPTDGMAFLIEEASCRRAYTEAELKQLFSQTIGEVRLLAMFGLYAGAMRLSDILGLKWSNIDLKNDVIRWRMSKRHGKHMETALSPVLKRELMSMPERKSELLVLPSFDGKSYRGTEAFRKALVAAGLRADARPAINRRYKERTEGEGGTAHTKYHPRNLQPREKAELDFHSLRYNFVSILKSNGCPEAIARSIMGHASVEVSAIYTQIDAESERKWVTSLPNVVG